MVEGDNDRCFHLEFSVDENSESFCPGQGKKGPYPMKNVVTQLHPVFSVNLLRKEEILMEDG